MAVSVTQGVFESIIRVKDEGSRVVEEFAQKTGAQFEDTSKKVSAAGRELDRSAEHTERASTNWALVGKAAAAGAVVVGTAAVAMVRNAINVADEMQRVSDTVGIGVEQLSALAYRADLADVPLEKLATNLTQMQRNLAQVAETGSGPAAKWLEKLQLDAKELVELGPHKALEALADAMEGLPTQAERLAAAQAIFNRGGSDMVRVLEGGAQALRESADEAKAFGAVISEETARQADKFNDNLGRLQTALGGVGKIIADDLIEPLAEMSEALVSAARDSEGLKLAAQALGLVLKALLATIELIATTFKIVGKGIAGLSAAFAALGRGEWLGALTTLRDMLREIIELGAKAGKFISDLFSFRKSAFGGAEQGGGFVKSAFFPADERGLHTFSDVLPTAELLNAEAQFQAQREEQLVGHLNRMLSAWRQFWESRRDTQVRFEQLNVDAAEYFFGQLSQLMLTKSRTLFEIGKIGAIAETIVSTYKGAQQAFTALAGIPFVGPALATAAAAAAIAGGLARVAAIKSVQFGTQAAAPVFAAVPATGLPAPSAAAAAPLPAAGAVPARGAREVNIYLDGSDVFSARTVRDILIPELNEAIGDGVKLNVFQRP